MSKVKTADMRPDKYITQRACRNKKVMPIRSCLCHLWPAWSAMFKFLLALESCCGSHIGYKSKSHPLHVTLPASTSPHLKQAWAPGGQGSCSAPKFKVEESHLGAKYRCLNQYPDVNFSFLPGPQLTGYRLYNQPSKGSSPDLGAR